MFWYAVIYGEHNLAGYEEDLLYDGTDRLEAFNAYKKARSWAETLYINISVRGRMEGKGRNNFDPRRAFTPVETDELPF